MQGAEERRLRRINNTPQGEATEGNTADDSLMVDQDPFPSLELYVKISENIACMFLDILEI